LNTHPNSHDAYQACFFTCRELKRRLRSEALLKNASLPPRMAAREKHSKGHNARMITMLQKYHDDQNNAKSNRRWRETSVPSMDNGGYTDDDRVSEEDSYSHNTQVTSTSKHSGSTYGPKKRPKNFTSFGRSRILKTDSGVFESTSIDNKASRLRLKTAK